MGMHVETTGGRLRLVRELLGLSQGELAKRLGVSGATVSRWESDDTELGSNEVRRVAAAMGVTPSVFYLEDEWQEMASALATVQRILEAAKQKGARDSSQSSASDLKRRATHVADVRPMETDDSCSQAGKVLVAAGRRSSL